MPSTETREELRERAKQVWAPVENNGAAMRDEWQERQKIYAYERAVATNYQVRESKEKMSF